MGSSSSTRHRDPYAETSIDAFKFVATTEGLDQFHVADDMIVTSSPGSHSRVRGTGTSSDMPRHPSQRPTIKLIGGG